MPVSNGAPIATPASPTRVWRFYFDATATGGRSARVRAALDAGKHVYVEKPLAETLTEALDLARRAERTGLKNGVVQDKLFLPGLTKLRKLYEADFFGRVLSIRLDFGWWVFDGMPYPAQRPSWNYRKAAGGGLIRSRIGATSSTACWERSKQCRAGI